MGSFRFGALVEQLATVATAAGTTTLVNTSKQNQVFTGSTTQTIVLPDATTMSIGQFYNIYNQSTGNLTLQFNGGAAFTDASGANYSTISPKSSLTITVQTIGTSAGTWAVTSSASGGTSASSGKNYISNYVPSLGSGNPNPGNGNFESGSTAGWSLAHSALSSLIPSSTATPGSAFSSSSGGTAANGNLSFTIVSSGQLAGLYSGDLASSSASTAGDMLISNAFFIDSEDQSKSMSIQLYYKANSGASNLNFSGTSSNSYAVYIYDVTNAVWIQPAGVYNLIQGSGAGVLNATFQTSSNGTNYQLALININASAGAFALYVDNFFVGPSSSFGIGTAKAPTVQVLTASSGTYTTPAGVSYIQVKMVGGGGGGGCSGTGGGSAANGGGNTTFGAATAGGGAGGAQRGGGPGSGGSNTPAYTTLVNLTGGTGSGGAFTNATSVGMTGGNGASGPFGSAGGGGSGSGSAPGASAENYSGSGGGGAGTGDVSSSGAGGGGCAGGYLEFIITNPATTYSFTTGSGGSGGSAGTSGAAGGNGGNGAIYVEEFYLNTSGGSGSGPVVAFDILPQKIPTGTLNGSFNLTTWAANQVDKDTAAGYNASNGTYTVPISGFYSVSVLIELAGTISNTSVAVVEVLVNNVEAFTNSNLSDGSRSSLPVFASKIIFCNAGDAITVKTQAANITGPSYTNGSGSGYSGSYLSINMVGGSGAGSSPSIGSVNCKYQNTAGTTIAGQATVPFATKVYDSNNAFNGSTGVFTAPVSGKYRISFNLFAAPSLTSTQYISAYTLCTSVPEGLSAQADLVAIQFGSSTAQNHALSSTKTYWLNAGDTLAIQAASDVSTTLSATAGRNVICIELVGS